MERALYGSSNMAIDASLQQGQVQDYLYFKPFYLKRE